MKNKFFPMAILLLLVMQLWGGCRGQQDDQWPAPYWFNRQVASDEAIFSQTAEAFIAALDARDAAAIKELFSPDVQQEDEDLAEQIDQLFAMYPGPTDLVYISGTPSSSRQRQDGLKTVLVGDSFPVVSGDDYYYCYIDIMLENDAHPEQEGVRRIYFGTAADYCGVFYEDWEFPQGHGLLLGQRQLDCEVRYVEKNLYKFFPSEQPLQLAEVEAFFQGAESYQYADFVARFGEPNASFDRLCSVYELAAEAGDHRYLRVYINIKTGNISSVNVVDRFQWLYKLYPEQEEE